MKLRAPQGAASCSHAGQDYAVDEDGIVEVPDEAAADLMDHGFTDPNAAVDTKPDTEGQLRAQVEAAQAALLEANATIEELSEYLAQANTKVAELQAAAQRKGK